MKISKAAVVTGAARGIGRAIALRLAKDGFNVVVSDVRTHELTNVKDEIGRTGQIAVAVTADVSVQSEVKNIFARCVEQFQRLDALVTAAGIAQIGTLDELDEESWDRTLDTNAKGTYLCVLEAAKIMRERKSGKIVTIASDFAIQGAKYFVCYSASKFAVRGMTQAFAKELAPYNINVNAIVPGIIWTDMWAEGDEKLSKIFGMRRGEAFKKFTDEVVLLPRAGKPEYIAPVASFLVSEDSDYITAATIPVGGGSVIF
jgi:meso-butanediol dehydrogenase/(S,S)-butanediol dehydrogenase/diacetyl reductase